MGTIFDHPYAPSTLGSFLREFTFGHFRQLDAVGSRFLCGLADRTPIVAGIEGTVFLDIDDTIIEVHGHGKQGSGYGYCGVRGLNALIATVSTERAAPVIVGQRLRRGSCGSPRGAARMLGDTLATIGRLRATPTDTATGVGAAPKVLVRADSAFYGYRAVRGGDPRRSRCVGDGAPNLNRQSRDRRDRRQRLDTHRVPTPSTTRTPAPGSRGPRSPKSTSPRSPPVRRASRYRGG